MASLVPASPISSTRRNPDAARHEARKAKPKDKPYKLTDEKGLYLQVMPAGGKLWRMNYRHEGKQKTISFGGYPDVSLAQAREKRDEARKKLKAGIDPMGERAAVNVARIAVAGVLPMFAANSFGSPVSADRFAPPRHA